MKQRMADVIRQIVTPLHWISESTERSESPKPNAENEGYDQRDPAYAHWDRQRSDCDLGLVDQPQQMPNCKNAEKHAGNPQSGSW